MALDGEPAQRRTVCRCGPGGGAAESAETRSGWGKGGQTDQSVSARPAARNSISHRPFRPQPLVALHSDPATAEPDRMQRRREAAASTICGPLSIRTALRLQLSQWRPTDHGSAAAALRVERRQGASLCVRGAAADRQATRESAVQMSGRRLRGAVGTVDHSSIGPLRVSEIDTGGKRQPTAVRQAVRSSSRLRIADGRRSREWLAL